MPKIYFVSMGYNRGGNSPTPRSGDVRNARCMSADRCGAGAKKKGKVKISALKAQNGKTS